MTLPRLAVLLLVIAVPASAGENQITYTVNQTFDDVTFGLENEIINQGLVVENVSHVGDMLDRTGEDVGSDVQVFTDADVYQFCSAKLSRKVMEADPMNVAFCPYGIFVAQLPGSEQTIIGYRIFPQGPMQKVQALLDKIVKGAIGKE